MASIKGGYAIMDLTDIFLSADAGVRIPDWQDRIGRIANKPIWGIVNGIGQWFSTKYNDTNGWGLVGIICNPEDISIRGVIIEAPSLDDPTIACYYAS